MKEYILFRIEDNNPIAVFVSSEGNSANKGRYLCYAHIGQHSEGNIDYLNALPLATKEQYAPLLSELQTIYTDGLEVLNCEVLVGYKVLLLTDSEQIALLEESFSSLENSPFDYTEHKYDTKAECKAFIDGLAEIDAFKHVAKIALNIEVFDKRNMPIVKTDVDRAKEVLLSNGYANVFWHAADVQNNYDVDRDTAISMIRTSHECGGYQDMIERIDIIADGLEIECRKNQN